jgi:hypothetical protein
MDAVDEEPKIRKGPKGCAQNILSPLLPLYHPILWSLISSVGDRDLINPSPPYRRSSPFFLKGSRLNVLAMRFCGMISCACDR